jgi:hypothetical protein
MKDGEVVRYRCHIRHAYTLDLGANGRILAARFRLPCALERIYVARRLKKEPRLRLAQHPERSPGSTSIRPP